MFILPTKVSLFEVIFMGLLIMSNKHILSEIVKKI